MKYLFLSQTLLALILFVLFFFLLILLIHTQPRSTILLYYLCTQMHNDSYKMVYALSYRSMTQQPSTTILSDFSLNLLTSNYSTTFIQNRFHLFIDIYKTAHGRISKSKFLQSYVATKCLSYMYYRTYWP